MKPARFDYYRPVALDEVFELLDRYAGEARVIAGGQSLVPMMNLRIARPRALIDLNSVADLSGIHLDGNAIRIGAMTRQKELLTDETISRHLPLVARAAGHIGHVQTRNRGTVGGSLANADPSAELSLVMVTLGATFKLESARGTRRVPAREFFLDALTTVIADGEVLTEIVVPKSPADAKIAFREVARRHGDFAIVSAAVERSSSAKSLVAAVGALATSPHVCSELTDALSAGGVDASDIERLVAQEIARVEPISDLNGSGEYRRRIAANLLLECLDEVLRQ